MNTKNVVGLACLAMGSLIPLAAQAQSAPAPTSSVSIYGVLDIGLTRVSDIGGQGITRMDDGISQGSRLGFRGREDLGGGLAALFNLEMGVATDDGTLRALLGSPIDGAERTQARDLVRASGGIESTIDDARGFAADAADALDHVAPSAARDILRSGVDHLVAAIAAQSGV